MDKLIHDPVYAAHNENICAEFPMVIAGVCMVDTPDMRALFAHTKNGKPTGLGYFDGYYGDEKGKNVFGYCVLAIDTVCRWRPPPTLLQDVEAALSELLGDMKKDAVELFIDVCWRNVHLGDWVWGPWERCDDTPRIEWTVAPPPPPSADDDDPSVSYDSEDCVFDDPYNLVYFLDHRESPYDAFTPHPTYKPLMPPCWDHSLEVFALPIQSGEDCCLVGKNLNTNGTTIEMPTPEEFDAMDAKLKKSLGKDFDAYLVGI